MDLRAEFDKLPFMSGEDDWRAFMVAETAIEAIAFIERGESERRVVWVHKPLTRLIANAVEELDEHGAFVEVGAGVQRWLVATIPDSEAVYEIQFRGWRTPTLALILNDAVYVWSPEGVPNA